LPISPHPIGFVLHLSPIGDPVLPRAEANWVRFAHFAFCRPEAAGRRAGVPPQLCAPSAIPNRGIGFVSHDWSRRPLCGGRQIGFVSHVLLSGEDPIM
jgi:hypothetical protein